MCVILYTVVLHSCTLTHSLRYFPPLNPLFHSISPQKYYVQLCKAFVKLQKCSRVFSVENIFTCCNVWLKREIILCDNIYWSPKVPHLQGFLNIFFLHKIFLLRRKCEGTVICWRYFYKKIQKYLLLKNLEIRIRTFRI